MTIEKNVRLLWHWSVVRSGSPIERVQCVRHFSEAGLNADLPVSHVQGLPLDDFEYYFIAILDRVEFLMILDAPECSLDEVEQR